MKIYETPEIKVCKFDVEDIIATSNDLTPGENETDIIFPMSDGFTSVEGINDNIDLLS